MNSLLFQGLQSLIYEKYAKANDQLLEAIEKSTNDEEKNEAIKHRGFALMGLKRYKEAQACFESIYSQIDSSMDCFERITREYGIACFYCESFATAGKCFSALNDSKSNQRWLRKIKRELELAPPKQTIAEKQPIKKKTVYEKLYFSHFQMGNELVINVMGARSIPIENRQVTIEAPFTVTLSFQSPNEDSPFVKSFNLFGAFTSGSVRHTTAKTAITLNTASADTWTSLEKSDVKETSRQGVYSGRQPDDWDKIDQSAKKSFAAEKPEGDQALNQLFESIYANATPQTKMAMRKSFIESGGTVLSTNWDEVGKQRVEPSPPPGMEYKKYDS
mmetsp:Transcript_2860/g.4122  ORF Transcript_2860/g.4122 Transcript_2860/m.4122 type:complete len:332 (+) Transcript_2860:16-1011(+)